MNNTSITKYDTVAICRAFLESTFSEDLIRQAHAIHPCIFITSVAGRTVEQLQPFTFYNDQFGSDIRDLCYGLTGQATEQPSIYNYCGLILAGYYKKPFVPHLCCITAFIISVEVLGVNTELNRGHFELAPDMVETFLDETASKSLVQELVEILRSMDNPPVEFRDFYNERFSEWGIEDEIDEIFIHNDGDEALLPPIEQEVQ